MNAEKSSIPCYGFNLESTLFRALAMVLTDTSVSGKTICLKENFHGSPSGLVAVLEQLLTPHTIFAHVFTHEMEEHTKELLVRLRFMAGIASHSTLVILTFRDRSHTASIFKSGGCHILKVPCALSEWFSISENRSITDKDRSIFLTRFGKPILLEHVKYHVATLIHDFPKNVLTLRKAVNAGNAEKLQRALPITQQSMNRLLDRHLPPIERGLERLSLSVSRAYPEIMKIQAFVPDAHNFFETMNRNYEEMFQELIRKSKEIDVVMDELRRRSYGPKEEN